MTWFSSRFYRKYESYLILPLKGVLPWMISPIDAKKLIFCVCLKKVFTIESVCTLSIDWYLLSVCSVSQTLWGAGEFASWLDGWRTLPHRTTLLLTTGLLFSVQRSVEILGNIKGSLYPHLTYNFEGKETAYKVRQNGKSNIKEVGRGWWSILSEGECLPLAPTTEQWVHRCGCAMQRWTPPEVMWTLTMGWRLCYVLETPSWRRADPTSVGKPNLGPLIHTQ